MRESKAMILGCAGLSLNEAERAFFKEENPFGFILFSRNIENAEQVLRLTKDLRTAIDNPQAPILIDQEGGRVQRLRPPIAANYPSASQLGEIYQKKADVGLHAVWLMSRLHAFDLLSLGINVNCLPVLDVPSPDGHEVIGTRAYSKRAEDVVKMGRVACEGLKAGGVLPVIKHMPGHGRAMADTHKELPIVTTPHLDLSASDFIPFKALSEELMAMSAHVVFSDIDTSNPATTSAIVIHDIIRSEIGFDGLLMSDDVSMNALSGDFAQRTSRIFSAGCDIVLHCGGDMDEMETVASNTPILSGASHTRAAAVLSSLAEPDDIDEQDIRQEFEALISEFGINAS
ncbi:beta-N-acetylhexosaminidase [Lentilitoribacter sp. Alg239-R112]|uniref:beta-N-acetylhexosaminidase n=1 Tax=Lentilitoribacter sp. Alg239-R112 TaxID=2305987 RepID=UPI0013A6D922|nr:beta-N-acetylhexosaminidase [Lentilitoribacter sp. Alg239-R112]